MRNYVTLFDRNYLAKGLALYQSLQAQSSEDFRLYIVPLDDFTRKYLEYQRDKFVIPKAVILDWNFLLGSIPEKPKPYNFFLLASEVTLTLMKMLRQPISYVDSDIYFFSDPKAIFDEIGNKDVAIVPHRFPPHDFARLSPNGLYNVSFVYFNNTNAGITTLVWWNESCRAKCDAESCGDQLYLNEFPGMLGNKLCVLSNIGIGAGPWNTYTYDVQEGPTLNGTPLVFYHYHEFKRDASLPIRKYTLTGYPTTENQQDLIYQPYIEIIDYCHKHIDKKAEEWYA